MLAQETAESLCVGLFHLLSNCLSCFPRYYTRNGHLADRSSALGAFLAGMAVLVLASEVTLVSFNRTRQRACGFARLFCCFAETTKDKPSRLLRYLGLARQLVTADPFAAGGHQESRHKPFLERQAALLVDRALADAELPFAVPTLVDAGPAQVVNLAGVVAKRAGDAVRPAQLLQVLGAGRFIWKGFQETDDVVIPCAVAAHALGIAKSAGCVPYIVSLCCVRGRRPSRPGARNRNTPARFTISLAVPVRARHAGREPVALDRGWRVNMDDLRAHRFDSEKYGQVGWYLV